MFCPGPCELADFESCIDLGLGIDLKFERVSGSEKEWGRRGGGGNHKYDL